MSAAEENLEEAEDMDESLLDLHEARDTAGAAMATALSSALSELDVLARGMRVVAKHMNQAQESVVIASMAFRADAAIESGLPSAAGDPKALLRQISTEGAGGDIISPRRMLQSLVTRTHSVLKTAGIA